MAPLTIVEAKAIYFTGARGELDFAKLAAYYGQTSHDVDAFRWGRCTAKAVILAMDRRAQRASPSA